MGRLVASAGRVGLVAVSAAVFALPAAAQAADEGVFTNTQSLRESIIFTAPAVTTNRVNAYSTQIVGRLLGGMPL
jgi:hypothetical protein